MSKDKKGLSDFEDDRLDADKKQSKEADARRYPGLRRWYWRFLFGFFALWGLVFGLAMLSDRYDSVALSLLLVPTVLADFICWLGLVYTEYTLRKFLCPRCGKRFTVGWTLNWPCKTCEHCDLYIG